MLVVGVVLLASSAWVGWRAYQAYRHLQAAHGVISQLTGQLDAGGLPDAQAVTSLADKLANQTESARDAVQDPVYRAATVLPWVGSNLQAVRQMTLSLDGIAQSARRGLPGILALEQHDSWVSAGHVDLPAVKTAARSVIDIDTAVGQATRSVRAIGAGHLVGPVAAAVNDYRDELDKVEPLTANGAKAARLIVPMLGGAGPRDYLIAFQNLAELRATGGIFGYYAVLHVDNGTMTLEGSGSSGRDIGVFDRPPVDLDPDMENLYSGRMAQYPQDVNFTPDFPTAAGLFAQMYHERTGKSVDGVVAIDPTVVSALLNGVPPISLGHGMQLSSSTAGQILLSELYSVYPSGAQNPQRDALMDSAASAAFGAILGNLGQTDPVHLAKTLAPLVGQRRVLIWSSSSAEESELLTTTLGGRLAPDAPGRPVVGVFFNDGTGGKLDYYLRASARLAGATCRDGAAHSTLTVTMADESPATGLPDYVVGMENIGRTYRLQTNVLLAAPSAGSITDVRIDGATVPIRYGTDHGRSVAVVTVDLIPGQHKTVTADVEMTSAAQGSPDRQRTVTPSLVVTPMVTGPDVTAEPFAACQSA